jgi:rhamnogalacturonyl hydrolase YesR
LLGSDYGRVSWQAHVDYRVFGALPLEIAMQTQNPLCRELGLKLANAQWENPTEDGITAEARYWIDDMYMISAVQVQAFRATGDHRHLDWAARAMAQYLDRIQQPSGLFFHAADSPFYWGRGNGWQAAGMAELLNVLPADHPQRARIVAGGRKMMEALLQHQSEAGLWRQLVDKPESWLETSGSAMFTFGMVSGVKDGWLDAAQYAPSARKAWLALVDHLDENALLREVCVGTNKAGQYHPGDLDAQYQFYLARERETGNLHGQAPMLWIATALLR